MRAAALGFAAAALLALAAAGPANATTWTVSGAGFGHGVGMSAYGALGYAQHSATFTEILHAYYTGVEVGQADTSARVRVLLRSAPGVTAFRLAVTACGRRLDARSTYRARRSGRNVELLTSAGARLANCGRRMVVRGDRISVVGLGRYAGSLALRPARGDGGAVDVINDVAIERYVEAVVAAELFPSWPPAALQAMAVAIRSTGLATHVARDYDVYADTRTQLYRGVGPVTASARAAALATSGAVITYLGQTVQAPYSSSSGGRTASGFLGAPPVPYLRSVDDPYDDLSPMHRWTRRFSAARMSALLAPWVRGSLERIEVLEHDDSPRIVSARIVGSGGARRIGGDALQSALGLPSRWASFTRSG